MFQDNFTDCIALRDYGLMKGVKIPTGLSCRSVLYVSVFWGSHKLGPYRIFDGGIDDVIYRFHILL